MAASFAIAQTTPSPLNLFNPKDPDIVEGHYIYKDMLLENPIYVVSGYMDLSGAPPQALLHSSGYFRFISFFTADRKYISYAENANDVPIPANAAFARMCLTKNMLNSTVVSLRLPRVPSPGFKNDICLPSVLYMLSGVQNDIFVQPLIKRWRPYDDFVRFSLNKSAPFMRRLSRVASIDAPVDGSTLTTELINSDEFEVIKRQSSVIRVGIKGAGQDEVTAQIIGDSYTQGAFFRKAILDPQMVPALKLVGLRKCQDRQYDEGRGGWTLQSYFDVPNQPTSSYHGFMQPDGNMRYWGARDFWVNAWQVFRNTCPKTFEPRYSCGRFDFCLHKFDEKTGILLTPEPGDVQYDNKSASYVIFDGKDWKPTKNNVLKWNFDYPKYLAMWKLKTPQFLFVVLGLNDFINNLNADFSNWDAQITTVKNSFLKANPNGFFVICIPCSTVGTLDNADGQFTIRQNAAMWRFRKHLIETFDKRVKDGFHLLDTGIPIDNDDGFNKVKQGPLTLHFPGAAKDQHYDVQTGNPHPYPNYTTLGLPLAAFIQYYRKK